MQKILSAISEIGQHMEAKGYEYFNVKYGGIGTNFKDAIAAYFSRVPSIDQRPVFPVYAASCVNAIDPGKPSSWATFTIVQDAANGLRIDTMNISMYECHGGPLQASLDVPIKSLEAMPSKQEAGKLVEAEWRRKRMEIVSKQQTPDPVRAGKIRQRKM